MKKNTFKSILMILPLLLFTVACDDDDAIDEPDVINSTTYDLGPVSDPNISGTATFSELDNGEVRIDLDLVGTPAGGEHPAHIHMNTAAEGGNIALSLEPVDGDTGESSITVDALDDGTSITYQELINYDGYINVHLSQNDLATLVAQGDIGQNDLTGTSKIYELEERDVDDIEGSVSFFERVNGEALAVIALENTPAGGEHPAHIHENSAAETGDIIYFFNPVNGNTGMSMSNVAALEDGTPFGYDDILSVDGYVNVHLSDNDLGTIVAQGDIGVNELTGNSIEYMLPEVNGSGVMGEVTFYERISGEALAEIDLDGTTPGVMHPAHIHDGSVSNAPGAIIFGFNMVDGDTGESMTHVAELEDGTAFVYDDIDTVDGYVNIHLSPTDLTVVAQNDIGINN